MGDQLRPERRTADSDHENPCKLLTVGRQNVPCVHVSRKFQGRLQRVIDLLLDRGVGCQLGVTQPVVTHHAVLVRIRDCPRFKLLHGLEGLIDLPGHRREQVVLKTHAADVDGESEV